MNNEERQLAQSAIDKAIATVAEEQFLRLARANKDSSTSTNLAEAIYTSFCSLDQLRRGLIPNYDEWDALFYLTWYQPSQINLVYSLLSENPYSIGEPSHFTPGLFNTGSDSVRVADFGCGCLATTFGVALAAADSYGRGQDIPEISVDCIDSSSDMMQIGKKTWDRFCESIWSVDREHPVCSVFEKINSNVLSHTSESEPNSAPVYVPCIVTAIHSTYSSTLETTKRALDELIDRLCPFAVYLSTDSSKAILLESVFPQHSPQSSYRLVSSHQETKARLETLYLERTTKWRQKLYSIYADDLFRESHCKINDEYFSFGPNCRQYLMNNVKWWKNDFCFKVFVQKDLGRLRGLGDIAESDDRLPF